MTNILQVESALVVIIKGLHTQTNLTNSAAYHKTVFNCMHNCVLPYYSIHISFCWQSINCKCKKNSQFTINRYSRLRTLLWYFWLDNCYPLSSSMQRSTQNTSSVQEQLCSPHKQFQSVDGPWSSGESHTQAVLRPGSAVHFGSSPQQTHPQTTLRRCCYPDRGCMSSGQPSWPWLIDGYGCLLAMYKVTRWQMKLTSELPPPIKTSYVPLSSPGTFVNQGLKSSRTYCFTFGLVSARTSSSSSKDLNFTSDFFT